MNPRAELLVEDVEVIHPDPALFFDEVEEDHARLGASFLRAEDPLELLGGDNGHHPEATVTLGPLEIGPDVIKLAVVPTSAIRFSQLEERDLVLDGEGLDFTTETVPDLLKQSGRRDGVSEVSGEEGDYLACYLEVGDVGIEIEAVHAGQVEADVPFEHFIDVRHTCHDDIVPARG